MTDDDEVEIPRMSMSHPASQQRLASDEMTRLKASFDRVKEFPEFNPNERAHWLEMRQAVEMYLRRWG
ncbi:MAG: hypothetical protein JKY36_04280 [Erythrobacter sp.]|nr:hypothetical protein [Erythrobacter sp.]